MRWYKITHRRHHKGIEKPSIVHDIAISHQERSEDAVEEVVAKAAQKMSSDWSTETRRVTNADFCGLAFQLDEFGIWMLTEAIIDPWQPIATAPKDGTLLRMFNKHNELCDTGRWSGGEWTTLHGNGEMTHWKPVHETAIKEGA